MNKLIVLVSLFGLVGCQDAQMNLGPEETTATGGSAGGTNVTVGAAAGVAGGTATPVGGSGGVVTPVGGSGGVVTPVGGDGGMGATAGTAFAGGSAGEGGEGGIAGEGGEGGIAGEGGEGGIAGEGGEGGGTTFHGIDLEGLQRFTFTSQGASLTTGGGPCWGAEPQVYTVDWTTKTLAFEHCVVASDGVTATRTREARSMTDTELTATLMHLRLISTEYLPNCGAGKAIQTLDLDFGTRQTKYQDDYYASCAGAADRGVIFVHDMDSLWRFLVRSRTLIAVPSEYDQLTLSTLPPDTVDIEWMRTACQTDYRELYAVDFAASTITLTSCGSLAAENRVGTSEKSRVLSASELAQIRSSVTALQLGATGDCSQELGVPVLWLSKGGYTLASVAGERAACPWSRAWDYNSVLHLDAVHTVLMYLINPPV